MKNVMLKNLTVVNNGKIATAKKNLATAKTARNQLNIMLNIQDLENENFEYLNLDSCQNNPIYKMATIICYHSLKTLATGRKYVDKDGNIKFTPSSRIAVDILHGANTSCNMDDLIQDVTCAILEHITSGDITLVNIGGNLRINGDDACRKEIFNVCQNKLRNLQEKHVKHLYNVTYVTDSNGEKIESDSEMYTLAQRAYNLSINAIESDGLINSLSVKLTEREIVVLKALLETKQVLIKNGTSHGREVYAYKTRRLTQAELSNFTGFSVQNVKTLIKRIRIKASDFILENDIADCKSYIEKLVINKK